jgi:transcriptional regulator EpsA
VRRAPSDWFGRVAGRSRPLAAKICIAFRIVRAGLQYFLNVLDTSCVHYPVGIEQGAGLATSLLPRKEPSMQIAAGTEDDILIKSREELDVLLVNIETSVKVKKRSDFFSWVQGVFQGMLGHEILICAAADRISRGYRMEWMASRPIDEARFAELCDSNGGLVHRLIALWEQSGRRPLLLTDSDGNTGVNLEIRAQIQRLELDNVVAHGIPDADGYAACFFCFSKLTGGPRPAHADTLELVVPYLHAAWVRAICDVGRQRSGHLVVAREILTRREVEILNWVEQGKSNNEIAQILSISYLTVKNHVQKIFRKLNVQNRAQAVAKGISLNLTRAANGYRRH